MRTDRLPVEAAIIEAKLEAEIAAEPISAIFNGSYTIQNRETGEHRTFRIRTQPQDAKFAPGKRTVALLDGPDNWTNYRTFGFVTERGVYPFRKHQDDAYGVYARLLTVLLLNPEHAAHGRYEVLVEAKCYRCNRKLTHPESIRTGIGPECAGRI